MTDFTQEIKRLQKLSCIALSPQQEKKLWTQLKDIIAFLGQLPDVKDSRSNLPAGRHGIKDQSNKLTLRTIKWVHQYLDTEKILKNIKHPMVNNSIVIKSVLS